MRVLILRTFMHQRVWEAERELCTFESTQWEELIKKWEPGYLSQIGRASCRERV